MVLISIVSQESNQFMRTGALSISVAAILTLAVAAQAAVSLSIESPRRAFYRGEIIALDVRVSNDGDALAGGVVTADLDGTASASVAIGALEPGGSAAARLSIPTAALRCDTYPLKVAFHLDETELAATTANVALAMRPNPDRLMVWLWAGSGGKWYREHGFTSWSGMAWNSLDEDKIAATRRALDEGLLAGGDCLLRANGGLRDLMHETFDDPDALYDGLLGWYTQRVAAGTHKPLPNPFHPEVARRQNAANRVLMEFARDYPQIRTAFFNTEVVDTMHVNRNAAGKQLMRDMLGFTEDDFGEPRFVAPGVIADDDPQYLFRKFAYQHGKGITLANRRTAEMIKRYRRDITIISDPFREAALYDLYPGLDAIETWTYTNPDPKLMLYIETLRAACKPTSQIPINVVTLLNYPGELDTSDQWMLMGPGRTAVTSWINLSRAPKIVGYYYSSACPPPGKPGDHRVPYETSLKIKELAERVYQPLGPMITQLDIEPRRIAVLSSESSRVHGTSPRLLGHYGNMQIYHFYTVLAMAHLNADVVFDETIERFGLDDYDVLVLPKCDVLTESVHRTIQDFQKRGGLVIADQYLGAELPGAVTFDFDFTYRDKVSAKAIAENKMYAQWDDQLEPDSAELKQVKGVTALDDQKIMESYAARLRETLRGRVDPDVSSDSPTVLLNMLEKDQVKYLVVINDKRSYDERLGRFKSVLGKLEPQTAVVRLHREDLRERVAYDVLSRERLEVIDGAMTVELTDLGGTIVALYPKAIGAMSIESPAQVRAGSACEIRVLMYDEDGAPLSGMQPIRLTLTPPGGLAERITSEGASGGASGTTSGAGDFSGYYGAARGVLRVPFVAAANDPRGPWTIEAVDLTSGRTATRILEIGD